MDRPSGLYSNSECLQWTILQAVPVYKEMIQNWIELGSCQAISQCPQVMSSLDTARFNLGLLEKEILGYLWYEALMDPSK